MRENSGEWLRKEVERIDRSLISVKPVIPTISWTERGRSKTLSQKTTATHSNTTYIHSMESDTEKRVQRQTPIAEHGMQMNQCKASVMPVFKCEQQRGWAFLSSGQWHCVICSRCFKGKYSLYLQLYRVPGKTVAPVQLTNIIILGVQARGIQKYMLMF